MKTTIPTSRRAYTIIEMIAVIVVIGTISSVVGSIVQASVTSYADASSQREAQESQSFALERMVRALREAAPLVGTVGTPGLVTADGDRCVFEDGTAFGLSGTDLLLTPPGGVQGPLARNITAFELRYIGDAGTELNFAGGDTIDMVRTIWIHLQSNMVDTHTCVYLRAAMGTP